MGSCLNKKNFLISAGSKGLGFATAKCLLQSGAQVSIASRNQENVDQALNELQEYGNAIGFVADVTKPEEIKNWFKNTEQEFKTINGLLVNAGGPPAGYFEDFNDQDWQQAYELNLLSTVRMAREIIPYLNHGGSVLVITSSFVKQAQANMVLSSTMRAGVVNLVKSLANTYAEQGIRFNNIMPGRIDTERVRSLDQIVAEKENKTPQAVQAEKIASIPLRRYGQPDEFGQACAFLLSDAASYITGTSLAVDGGLMKSIL